MNWAIPEVDTYFRKILDVTPGGFEIDHLQEALKYCTRFRTAIDGGAHIGTWAAHMANYFDRVLAFEPAPDTYDCLMKNTIHYNNVLPIRAALGACKGKCIIVDDPSREGNTGARTIFTTGKNPTVPLTTVDEQGLRSLDLLKLDVEGYEIEALKGAVKTIRLCQPVIVVECKQFSPPRNGGVEVVHKYLAGLSYKEVGGVRNDRIFTSQ